MSDYLVINNPDTGSQVIRFSNLKNALSQYKYFLADGNKVMIAQELDIKLSVADIEGNSEQQEL